MKNLSVILSVILLAGCSSVGTKTANDYLAKSEMYYKTGNLKAAWDNAQKALEKDKNAVAAYGTMGTILYDQGNYDEAIKYFTVLYQAGDKRSEVLSALGAAYAAKGDYDNALTYLEASLKLNPSNFAALTSLGGIYYSKEEYQKAVDIYTNVIALYPVAAVYAARGAVYEKLGKTELALQDYKTAGIELPDSAKTN